MPKNQEQFVIILAGGQGKRMHSPLPKVLQECHGRPMLERTLENIIAALPNSSIGVVVGHASEQVETFLREYEKKSGCKTIQTFLQSPPLGTGHAVQCVLNDKKGEKALLHADEVYIFPGDLPLISKEMVAGLRDQAISKKSSGVLLTTTLQDPKGYGRVVSKKGFAQKIIEEKDASEKIKKIKEVACSIYKFSGKFLVKHLSKIKNNNAQSEYYLTDLIEFASKGKTPLTLFNWEKIDELRGVNDFWEMACAEKTLREKIIENHARKGVRFTDPWSCVIEENVQIEVGTKIHRGVVLRGKTSIGKHSDIGANSVLKNMIIGENVQIKAGTYAEDSEVGNHASVGPYAHLRPESKVGQHSKIGNFVELKKSIIGDHTSVAHLSYLGDATVGSHVNIGCGFVTCNYDGRVINGSRKHKTIIEDDCFIGSDCQVIAPIQIRKGAYIASGSTVNKDVPEDALAIGRSRQENKLGYAVRLRPKK